MSANVRLDAQTAFPLLDRSDRTQGNNDRCQGLPGVFRSSPMSPYGVGIWIILLIESRQNDGSFPTTLEKVQKTESGCLCNQKAFGKAKMAMRVEFSKKMSV